MPYGHASMLLLGEGSEATEPYNKYDKIRPHSIRSLQFDQKVRPLSFRPEKFDLFTATHRRYPSDELFKRSEIMNVFDLYVFELLKFAVRSSRESQLDNIKSVFIHKISLVFTRSVSSNMFYVPEARTQVSRQSLKYPGTVLLNHLLKTKLLPRNYESIGENETKRLILKIKNKISSERLADIVFC